jgi:hypothetical protein
MNRLGAVGSSLKQFAERQAQDSALRQHDTKPRCSKSVRGEEGFVFHQGPQLRPLSNHLCIRHRRSQPGAAKSILCPQEFHLEIGRLETGLGKGVIESRRSSQKPTPAHARQRNPAGLERGVGCDQGHGSGHQAIGAHGVAQLSDPHGGTWMRRGKRTLHLLFGIAVKNRAPEQKDEPPHGQNERTQRSPHAGQPPLPRQLPARRPCSFVHASFWQSACQNSCPSFCSNLAEQNQHNKNYENQA